MRTNMQAGRALVLGTGALIAALTVVGCGAGQSTSGSASPAQPTSSATATRAAGGQDVATHTTTSGGGACTSAELSAKLGTRKQVPVDPQGQLGAAGTHYTVDLVWTNTSSAGCTLTGFGGVDIDGPNSGPAGGPTYSLPRNGDTPHTVTLAPGSSAHTVINYIDSTGSSPDAKPWTPTHLSVTPPNQTTPISVPWTTGTAVYFDPADGAAAASISPVTAGR